MGHKETEGLTDGPPPERRDDDQLVSCGGWQHVPKREALNLNGRFIQASSTVSNVPPKETSVLDGH